MTEKMGHTNILISLDAHDCYHKGSNIVLECTQVMKNRENVVYNDNLLLFLTFVINFTHYLLGMS